MNKCLPDHSDCSCYEYKDSNIEDCSECDGMGFVNIGGCGDPECCITFFTCSQCHGDGVVNVKDKEERA